MENLPKSFDPARASASPETDIVRALYDGLVDLDAKNLQAVPAIAEKWTSSEDHKIWTFELRQNAKWSNGEQITAEDFVRSWRRLTELGNK
ncbi:MAG: peptide ABC transporter substrate-binding protein, partial [Blastocatellia bacterium]|nr:peptide ABC transporter substrate-binding protein [Blastocatellia bacterium]